MYKYSELDKQILNDRINQYRDQTTRFLDGALAEGEYLPLRLQNGLYVQRYAPMMRIAVPYGLLSSTQLRKLSHIARHYDKGYLHVSTRQNIQINWPHLEETPEILAELATVEMHANQTSGNCIRNVTTNQFAGVDADEVEDPRPWCELVRQWSTYHPEFLHLPRKFKIAFSANKSVDRAVVKAHDIGIYMHHNENSELFFEIVVGGGLGRTPIVGKTICDNLAPEHLLSYLEAIMRVYNKHGRRDNKYKARIKILVKALGVEAFREMVEKEWADIKDGALTLDANTIETTKAHFTEHAYSELEDSPAELTSALEKSQSTDKSFYRWHIRNVAAHKKAGYSIVTINLKATERAPGDLSDFELDKIADLADKYSFGEVRTTHEQNIVLADVPQKDLPALFATLYEMGMAAPEIGLINDMICCPGGDFCSLANAKSLPIAESIQRRFDDLDYVFDIGDLDLNISGCMNACGHHHIGHIGILGVDKKGEEFYQIQLGGSSDLDTSLGKVLGRAVYADQVPDTIETIINTYIESRIEGERFIDTYRRVGIKPFKERVYAA